MQLECHYHPVQQCSSPYLPTAPGAFLPPRRHKYLECHESIGDASVLEHSTIPVVVINLNY